MPQSEESAVAFDRLKALSTPSPLDLSLGHHATVGAWKVMDGGVVEWRYQAFCRCNWSQPFPCKSERAALVAHAAHASNY